MCIRDRVGADKTVGVFGIDLGTSFDRHLGDHAQRDRLAVHEGSVVIKDHGIDTFTNPSRHPSKLSLKPKTVLWSLIIR